MCVVIHIPILTAVEHRFLLLEKTVHSSKTASCSIIFVSRIGKDWSLVFLTTWGCGFYVYLFLFLFCLAIFVPDVLCHKCVIWSHMSLESIYICCRKWGHLLYLFIFLQQKCLIRAELFSYFQCNLYWRSALCLWDRVGFFVLDFFHVIMTDLMR